MIVSKYSASLALFTQGHKTVTLCNVMGKCLGNGIL